MGDGSRVLVMGGTQGTGELIVHRLLDEGYRVRVLARTPEKAERKYGDRVEIVAGDVTLPESLPPAVSEIDHLILTVGIPHRIASRSAVRETVHDGTLNSIRAAHDAGMRGRFLYMSALGTTRWSVLGFLLDMIKGRTLRHRRKVEEELRRSELTHTIIHAGILNDHPPGRHPVEISQQGYALRPRFRIARADVAEVFVRALSSPHAANTTMDAVWARGGDPGSIDEQLSRLVPDR